MRKFYIKQNSVKPKHKSPKCLATPFTVQGVKWKIHNHDKDINNPSCPHMHAIGKPWKLNIYTGRFYDEITGQFLGKIKYDDLLMIWKTKGIMKIILAERAIYEELHKKNPVRFPTLPQLLEIDEINKIQVSNNNRHKKQNFHKHGTGVKMKSHLHKTFLESKAYQSSFSLQKPITKKIVMNKRVNKRYNILPKEVCNV